MGEILDGAPEFAVRGGRLFRLKTGLQRAGLHASYFAWPPEHDPNRAPYRGLKPLEVEDAGIFFGETGLLRALEGALTPRRHRAVRLIATQQLLLPNMQHLIAWM